MKAALVNAQGDVENIIVWDNTCVAPIGLSVVVLSPEENVSPSWTYSNGIFTDPNPSIVSDTLPKLTPSEKLANAGLSVDELKTLLGIQ